MNYVLIFSEIETFFQAMFSVIYTLSDDTKDTASIISSIATSTTSSQNDKPIVRLAVLVTLFNLIFDASSKCEVLVGKQTILYNSIYIYSIYFQ